MAWSGLTAVLAMSALLWPEQAFNVVVTIIQIGFVVCAVWRVVHLLLAVRARTHRSPPPSAWPAYTIMAALHDEVEVVPQLIRRLAEIDYPPDRLQALILLEAHDLETIDAVIAADRPSWMQAVIVPPGAPGTKPRALNHGLARATGRIVTIYDAEDDPDPLQLKEAAARFAGDAEGRLACLQAPLRIRTTGLTASTRDFFGRQFAVEYAALFEIALPAMARLGLPFPLGGTSNHFRIDALRQVGGWDAYNVTEDADLGFRLCRAGWRMGVIYRPTYETPPLRLEVWLPQRTRWLKGYMQTWGVHTRSLTGLGWRGLLSLTMTIGVALVSALLHAVSIAWILASIVVAVAAEAPPSTPRFALSVLVLGAAAAWIVGAFGARRAAVPYTAADMVLAPAYWSLLSFAFVHAVWRLIREPHVWDKTRHWADAAEAPANEAEDEKTGDRMASAA